MDKNDLIAELNSFKTAERMHRDKSAKFVLHHIETFPFLVELLFENQNRINIKAAWVFELVCYENISLMVQHLAYFSKNLKNIHHESALRPIAKVCAYICKTHFSDVKNKLYQWLSEEDMLYIVESNFDWLVEDHKVATKVFAMETLFFLGFKINWVHDELRLTLEKNIIHNSAGYQARAKKILKNIKALNN